MTERIHQVSFHNIEGRNYALPLTEREYAALRSLSATTARPASRILRESVSTIRVLSNGASMIDLAARACLPPASWLRLVLLSRVGVCDLAEQLACVAHA